MTWYEYGNEVYYCLNQAWMDFQDPDIVNRESEPDSWPIIEQIWAIKEKLA